MTILENYPRDELLQIDADELFATAMGILRLAERQRVRAFVHRDQFGRYLRYVWLGDELINETLVAEGFAYRYRDAEDRTYEARIIAAENAARNSGRGLWGACR